MKSKHIKLLFTFLIYSAAVIFGKIASQEVFGSFNYLFFLFAQFLLLGVYAVLWQFNLTSMKLNEAYSMKPITIIFGLIAGVLLFKETISIMNLVGVLVILIGIFVVIRYE